MKNFMISIASLLLFLNCTKQSELSEVYNCATHKIENPKVIIDFNKNFSLSIPNTWKSKLYFSEFESEIFVADTIKQLTESFILGTSFNNGTTNFSKYFFKKTDSILAKNNLQIINSGKQPFQSKPTYWYIAKGLKNGFTYHYFNLTSKHSESNYFTAYSEIYGDNNVEDRICKTIAILEKIEFLK